MSIFDDPDVAAAFGTIYQVGAAEFEKTASESSWAQRVRRMVSRGTMMLPADWNRLPEPICRYRLRALFVRHGMMAHQISQRWVGVTGFACRFPQPIRSRKLVSLQF